MFREMELTEVSGDLKGRGSRALERYVDGVLISSRSYCSGGAPDIYRKVVHMARSRTRRFAVGLIGTLVLAIELGLPATGQGTNLLPQTRSAVIDTVSARLQELYLYPEVAAEMVALIQTRHANGGYDEFESLEVFLDELNRDLLSVFPDGHLSVDLIRDPGPSRSSDENWWDTHRENARFNNSGFHRLERLPGNVGYLELTEFDYPELAGETLVAAMRYLAHTDAMIIDLRQNPGGRGELVQLLLSYFFADHRVQYLTEKDGVRKITRQWWTLPYVSGPRRPDLPLFVLTSANTGSAAEEFAFALMNLRRATLVGETTAGAAHKTHRHPYPDLGIEISMPDGRSYDPVTGEDWEGTGVTPDVEIAADSALAVAHILALDALLADETENARRFRLDWARRGLQAEQSPVILDQQELLRYVGTYGQRRVFLEGNTLLYQRENRPEFRLVALGDHWFALQGLDYFRIRFEAEADGRMGKLVGVYDDGSESVSERTDL
jgi:hypothetical protein